MRSGRQGLLFATLLGLAFRATYAQTPLVGGQCSVTSVPAPVRTEGLTERLGDILISCSGSLPGAVLTGNLTVAFPVNVTNRVGSNNVTTDAVIAADVGSGFVTLPVSAQVNGTSIVFSGIQLTAPASGAFALRVSGIRVAVAVMGSAPKPIQAQLIFSGSPLPMNQTQIIVGIAQPALFTTTFNRGVINCVGSPVPSTVTLQNLFSAGTFFFSDRVTEGFSTAFLPRAAGEDNGTRVLLQFSKFPTGTRIFVPDYIAGSTAAVQTAGGDMGVPQSGGAYVPGSSSLLLARVTGSDAAGAGGTVTLPTGVGPIAFNGASEVSLSSTGSGSVAFEVVDANPNARESAQIPVFIGMPAGTPPATAQASISLGPLSGIQAASPTAPIVRFMDVPAGEDCGIVSDCSAGYYPKLGVDSNPIRFTAIAGGISADLPGYIRILNDGGGVMPWTATVQYTNGSGWVFLSSSSGVNTASVLVVASAKGLTPGTYRANVTIDAGPRAGSGSVPVTLVVSPTPAPPSTPPGSGTTTPPPPVSTVAITRVVNAATFDPTPLVAGSLGTAMGTNLAGKAVSVSLDGFVADVLYTSATQINFVVPGGLRGKSSASMVVAVDGASSSPQMVILAPAWPSIFKGGVLNENNSGNGADAPAEAGSVLQIYATGIPESATVFVEIGDRKDLVPMYAGSAPTVPGVQQVNVAVPEGLAGSPPLSVCAAIGGAQPVCSPGYPVVVR